GGREASLECFAFGSGLGTDVKARAGRAEAAAVVSHERIQFSRLGRGVNRLGPDRNAVVVGKWLVELEACLATALLINRDLKGWFEHTVFADPHFVVSGALIGIDVDLNAASVLIGADNDLSLCLWSGKAR